MLVPHREDMIHALTIRRVPHDRVPIGLQNDRASIRFQHAIELGERSLHGGDIFIDLRRDTDIEMIVRKIEMDCIRQAKFDLRLMRAILSRHRQQGFAGIHAAADSDVPPKRGVVSGVRHEFGQGIARAGWRMECIRVIQQVRRGCE